MPYVAGIEILSRIRLDFPEIPVVIMTSANYIETAVDCMKIGAFDYLVKPVEMNRFLSCLKRALEFRSLRDEISSVRNLIFSDELKHVDAFSLVVTRNKKMLKIFQYVEAIAPSNQPVLITGETGVGKELIAEVIHKLSQRKGRFIAVNIAGLDDTMFSDTLFGHKKGAFTGAMGNREGLIAQASGGTLFLGEIGDLSGSSQVKLLRLLQEHIYYSLGSDVPKHTDARIIVATNKDIRKADDFRKV
jgi:DNA-binding NtrC family response regulator